MTPLAGKVATGSIWQKWGWRLAAMAVAVILHLALAAPFLWQPAVESPPPAPPALEVAMVAMAPAATDGAEEAPDEPELEPEPEPEPVPEPEPEPEPEVVLEEKPEPPPEMPKETPKEVKKPETPKERTEPKKQMAQSQAQESSTEAAPHAGQGKELEDAEQMWQQQLRVHLDRRKRYPRQAQRMRQEGAPVVRFTLDAKGNVVQVAMEKASGIRALDQEALALVKRAQPLPAPPKALVERSGGEINVTLPIEFSLTQGKR